MREVTPHITEWYKTQVLFLKIKQVLFITMFTSHCPALGHYAYIETSSPRKPNDTANLISPTLDQSGGVGCLVFWYHMYGADINSLAVLKKVGDILNWPY